MILEGDVGWMEMGSKARDIKIKNIVLHMADSCCYMVETNIILLSNYPPIKNLKNNIVLLYQV